MTTRKAPWENQSRHYCEYCNKWMGSDRQSILLHENGRKHKENVEKANQDRRQNKLNEEQKAKAFQETLRQMEASALGSHANDLEHYHVTPGFEAVPAVPAAPTPVISEPAQTTADERKAWDEKKRHRKEGDEVSEVVEKKQKRTIAPDEGHYSYDDNTYLEGQVFGEILEEDVPVQLWTGPMLASAAEKRLIERSMYWKEGLVAAVRKRPSAIDHEDRLVVDVAYLKNPDDTEETLEKSVSLNRIRVVLGGDKSLPDTLEEARLLALGGEEIEVNDEQKAIDDTTGFTSWSTVSIKRTTIRQELKEERERLRKQRKEAMIEAERLKKEAEARKMEEAKVANADDSALGAFDVWNRNKAGYKGVDISAEAETTVHDMGKKLSEGNEEVAFKKPFKSKKQKMNRRTTSADDD